MFSSDPCDSLPQSGCVSVRRNLFCQSSRCGLRSGYSLVEIMVVLIIIGLLAGATTLGVRHFLISGKQNVARTEIAAIADALESFYVIHGRYPTNDEGLDVLTTKSETMPEPLLTQDPVDPWGRQYQYNQPGRNGPYEVICYGADGREGGDGDETDIVSWDLKQRTGQTP